MFFVKKSNYLDRDNGEAFESKECVGLSEHVGEKHCSFHDDHVSVFFIDLSVHDLYTSIVANYVLKIGVPAYWTMQLTSFEATLSQHRIVANIGLIEL